MSTIFIERPGIELEERLKKANINYRQFAKAINVAPSCISQIISGKRSISMVAAQKIADYFNETNFHFVPNYYFSFEDIDYDKYFCIYKIYIEKFIKSHEFLCNNDKGKQFIETINKAKK